MPTLCANGTYCAKCQTGNPSGPVADLMCSNDFLFILKIVAKGEQAENGATGGQMT